MITINQNSKIVTSACFETLDNGLQQVIINLYSKEYEFLSSSSHSSHDKSFDFGTPDDYENISTVTVSGINAKSLRYDSRCKDQLILLYVPFDMITKPTKNSEYTRWNS